MFGRLFKTNLTFWILFGKVLIFPFWLLALKGIVYEPLLSNIVLAWLSFKTFALKSFQSCCPSNKYWNLTYLPTIWLNELNLFLTQSTQLFLMVKIIALPLSLYLAENILSVLAFCPSRTKVSLILIVVPFNKWAIKLGVFVGTLIHESLISFVTWDPNPYSLLSSKFVDVCL